MIAWHDRVGDLTLFEALMGGAFDHQNSNIAGIWPKFFKKVKCPGVCPGGGGGGGGMGDFGIDRYIRIASIVIHLILQSTPTHVMAGLGYSAITPLV